MRTLSTLFLLSLLASGAWAQEAAISPGDNAVGSAHHKPVDPTAIKLAPQAGTAEFIYQYDALWIMMRAAGFSYDKAATFAPHLPKPADGMPIEAYVQARLDWLKNYPEELPALMNQPEVAKFNFSLADLGVNLEKPRVFTNGMLEIITAEHHVGMSWDEILAVAPHFPKVKHTGDIDRDEWKYQEVLNDWMNIYPEEFHALLESPKFKAFRQKHGEYDLPTLRYNPDMNVMAAHIWNHTAPPTPEEFDSGNPELDAKRYAFAAQLYDYWYMDGFEYVKKYNITNYHVDLENKNNQPNRKPVALEASPTPAPADYLNSAPSAPVAPHTDHDHK